MAESKNDPNRHNRTKRAEEKLHELLNDVDVSSGDDEDISNFIDAESREDTQKKKLAYSKNYYPNMELINQFTPDGPGATIEIKNLHKKIRQGNQNEIENAFWKLLEISKKKREQSLNDERRDGWDVITQKDIADATSANPKKTKKSWFKKLFRRGGRKYKRKNKKKTIKKNKRKKRNTKKRKRKRKKKTKKY